MSCPIHEGARMPCSRCAKVAEVNGAAADELGEAMRAKRKPVTAASGAPALAPVPVQGWRRRKRKIPARAT